MGSIDLGVIIVQMLIETIDTEILQSKKERRLRAETLEKPSSLAVTSDECYCLNTHCSPVSEFTFEKLE